MTKVIKGKREGGGLSSSHFDLVLRVLAPARSVPIFCGFGSDRFLSLAFRVGTPQPVELPSISSIPFLVRAEVRCVASVFSLEKVSVI